MHKELGMRRPIKSRFQNKIPFQPAPGFALVILAAKSGGCKSAKELLRSLLAAYIHHVRLLWVTASIPHAPRTSRKFNLFFDCLLKNSGLV